MWVCGCFAESTATEGAATTPYRRTALLFVLHERASRADNFRKYPGRFDWPRISMVSDVDGTIPTDGLGMCACCQRKYFGQRLGSMDELDEWIQT